MNLKAKEIRQDSKSGSLQITVEQYKHEYKNKWDQFIGNSKNGTFLFYRDYMEYHADRFKDFSLMFFKKDKLVAVMPANIDNDVVISHGGLTYGGIVSDENMKASLMLEIFEALKEYLKAHGVNKLVYKVIPHIYHSLPAEEDLYALFRYGAKLVRRDIASTIFLDEKLDFYKQKRKDIKRCIKSGLEVKRDHDFEGFMAVKEYDLVKKYGIKPVHSADEIKLLESRFPDNIKLFTVRENGEILAGRIVYENKHVVHGQYHSSTDRGKKLKASSILVDYLINDYFKEKKYFDLGISTEENGNYLNEGLIRFKEEFGARGIAYDFYEMDL